MNGLKGTQFLSGRSGCYGVHKIFQTVKQIQLYSIMVFFYSFTLVPITNFLQENHLRYDEAS